MNFVMFVIILKILKKGPGPSKIVKSCFIFDFQSPMYPKISIIECLNKFEKERVQAPENVGRYPFLKEFQSDKYPFK